MVGTLKCGECKWKAQQTNVDAKFKALVLLATLKVQVYTRKQFFSVSTLTKVSLKR
jgi:hypothetical protein